MVEIEKAPMSDPQTKPEDLPEPPRGATVEQGVPPGQPKEIGGPKGPEPTRYGDWEKNGRCIDF
jgi:hypothetical protein